jgi:hypothetical protein
MDVEIDHQHLPHRPLGQQPPRRHGHIVEHAEPRPALGVGMVAAAGGVAGQAKLQGQAGGQ